MVGTPYYIAPEVVNSESTYGPKADCWGAGILLYILLSGKPPFDGENNDEILEKVKKYELEFTDPIFKMISAEGLQFLKKMLDFNESTRFTSFQGLTHVWFKKAMTSKKGTNLNNQQLKDFNGRVKL